MGNTVYIECSNGISGDMLTGALLDLGADEGVLGEALASLPVTGFQVEIGRVKKSGLDACDFSVILNEEHENHDHNMEYLHGEGHGQVTAHSHGHRTLQDILQIIGRGRMTERARVLAERIFRILAEAEAAAHGTSIEEVHFHEVGAVDSIADIVAIAVCADNLDITQVIVPSLYEGSGFVRCQHGLIPVPVPAVLNIVQSYGIKLHMTGVEGELVTPTGAAAVAALVTSDRLPERFVIRRTGTGAGKRSYERPSLVRAMLIEAEDGRESMEDVIWKLESNIDDSSGEELGYVMEILLKAGARDVHYMPVYMKKNRPAYQLNILCMEEDIQKLEQILFRETTTIGIRRCRMERTILPRRQDTVSTPLGEITVKLCRLQEETRVYPEYDSVTEKCREFDLPYRQVYDMAVRSWQQKHPSVAK